MNESTSQPAAAPAPTDPAISRRRRVAVLNDTSEFYHWGCTGTTTALVETIRAKHEVRTVPIGALTAEGTPRRWTDFGSASFFDSVRLGFPAIAETLDWADTVVINGEGTLHGMARGAIALLYLAHASKVHLGKDVQIVNHSCYPQHRLAFTESRVYALYREVYAAMDFVAVRDPLSHALLCGMGIDAVRSFDCLPLQIARTSPHQHDGRSRRLLLSGSVSWTAASSAALVRFLGTMRDEGFGPAFLRGANGLAAREDGELAGILRGEVAGGIEDIEASSLDEWFGAIASSAVLVSGRFHHSIAAAMLGTPFVTLCSNTPKMEALAEIGAPPALRFDDSELADRLAVAARGQLERAGDIAVALPGLRADLCRLATRNFEGLGIGPAHPAQRTPPAPVIGAEVGAALRKAMDGSGGPAAMGEFALDPADAAERVLDQVEFNPEALRLPMAEPPGPRRARVLLIGNGPGALKYRAASQIDQFDGVVARFNEYRIKGFEEFVGTRVDEWITWTLFEEPSRREYDRVLYSLAPPAETWPRVHARYPHAGRIADETFAQTRRQMGYELPSSGAFVTMHYLGLGYQVVLHGFDFFQGPRHHYGDQGERGYRHSPGFEVAFFRKLLAEGRVTMLTDASAEPSGGVGADGEPRADWQLREYQSAAALRLAQIEQMERRLAEVHQQKETLGRSWQELHAHNASLQETVRALQAEKEALAQGWDERGRHAQELQRVADALAAEKHALAKDWNVRGDYIAELGAARRHADEEIARLRAGAAELEARLGRAQLARDQTLFQYERVVKENLAAQEARRVAEFALAEALDRLAAEQAALASARERLSGLSESVINLQRRPLYRLLARSRALPPIDGPRADGA